MFLPPERPRPLPLRELEPEACALICSLASLTLRSESLSNTDSSADTLGLGMPDTVPSSAMSTRTPD